MLNKYKSTLMSTVLMETLHFEMTTLVKEGNRLNANISQFI